MTTRKTPSKCPACDKTDEQCADGRKCPRWQTSLEVCVLFGTRLPQKTYEGPRTN